jgi:hypothetical protein
MYRYLRDVTVWFDSNASTKKDDIFFCEFHSVKTVDNISHNAIVLLEANNIALNIGYTVQRKILLLRSVSS